MNDFVTGSPSRGSNIPDKMINSLQRFDNDWYGVIIDELDRRALDGVFVSTTGTPESELVCGYLNNLLLGIRDE